MLFHLHDIHRYVKSKDDKQLSSKADEKGSSSCEPELTYDGKPIVPCGLIAWSLFNDTYSLSANNKTLLIDKKNIAWKSDKTTKFGSDVYPKNFQQGDLIGGAKLNKSIPVSISILIAVHSYCDFHYSLEFCKKTLLLVFLIC